ncbi:MAG TPA: hypothetical protein VMT85_13285 [Thermoanaerobaculia bacterium]|nr:hypothetical protein [Thermoanaerobaculia bacterium]
MGDRVESPGGGGAAASGPGVESAVWAPWWLAFGVALPAAAGLLLSALANRLSFLACGVAVAGLAAAWLLRALRAGRGALALRALTAGGVAAVALGGLAIAEIEALTLGSAAVLGGAGVNWAPRALLITGAAQLAVSAAWLVAVRRSRRPVERRLETETETEP